MTGWEGGFTWLRRLESPEALVMDLESLSIADFSGLDSCSQNNKVTSRPISRRPELQWNIKEYFDLKDKLTPKSPFRLGHVRWKKTTKCSMQNQSVEMHWRLDTSTSCHDATNVVKFVLIIIANDENNWFVRLSELKFAFLAGFWPALAAYCNLRISKVIWRNLCEDIHMSWYLIWKYDEYMYW